MKFRIDLLPVACLLSFFLTASSSYSEESSVAPGIKPLRFKTEDQPSGPPFRARKSEVYPPPLRENAPEELPANEDVNGRWGEAIGGYQVSLRLSNNKFLVGEPVIAFPILRNVGTTVLYYSSLYHFHTWFSNLHCWDENHHQFPCRPPGMPLKGQGTLSPQTQHRSYADLTKIYDLSKPGRYTVQAVSKLPLVQGGTTNVTSGLVEFEILATPKP